MGYTESSETSHDRNPPPSSLYRLSFLLKCGCPLHRPPPRPHLCAASSMSCAPLSAFPKPPPITLPCHLSFASPCSLLPPPHAPLPESRTPFRLYMDPCPPPCFPPPVCSPPPLPSMHWPPPTLLRGPTCLQQPAHPLNPPRPSPPLPT